MFQELNVAQRVQTAESYDDATETVFQNTGFIEQLTMYYR